MTLQHPHSNSNAISPQNPLELRQDTAYNSAQSRIAPVSNTPTIDVNYTLATSAFNCVSKKAVDIRTILQEGRYDGSYGIQVGFSEELLYLDKGILQEVYISFNKKLRSHTAQEIADCLYPFPVHVYTSNRDYQFRPPSSSLTELHEIWVSLGIYQSSVESWNPNTISPPVDGNKAPRSPSDGDDTSRQTGDKGTGDGNAGGGGKQFNQDDDHGGDDRGDDESSGSGPAQPEASEHTARVVSSHPPSRVMEMGCKRRPS